MSSGIIGVLAIWFLAVVSPGPAFLVVSQTAAGRSRRAALGVSLGIATGAILYATLTLMGLAVMITRISWLGYALRFVGAAYLIYLGITLWRAPRGDIGGEAIEGATLAKGFRTGLLTALTNPKGIAFFLSLFAVALPHDLTATQSVLLLSSGFAIELGWYVLVSLAFSTSQLRAGYLRARKAIERVLGSALVLLGLRLGTETP
jgi:threonine/homoserine/homoserine lactone efflux protein